MTAPDRDEIGRLAATTRLCISLADRPSRFGITVHNAAFRALELDYLYKAFRPADLSQAIAGIRGLGIRGCGVSMPYKVSAMDYVDAIDPPAAAIGAINTIVNDDGFLTGYNTDATAAFRALSEAGVEKTDRVLLLGAGGVARAILHALSELGVDAIHVAARNLEAARELDTLVRVKPVSWQTRHEVDATAVINATPIGMRPDEESTPLDVTQFPELRMLYEVVVDPPQTRLISAARARGCGSVIDGLTMSVYQASEQFRLYTGREAPLDVMRRAAAELFQSSA